MMSFSVRSDFTEVADELEKDLPVQKKKEMDACTIMIAALLTIIKVAEHMNRPFWQCEDCDTTI